AAQAQADHETVMRRRRFRTVRAAGGRHGEFFLTEADGALLETALDAIAGRPAKDDTRTREQRLADALVTLAGRMLQLGDDRLGAQVRPHLALVVNQETWTAMSRHRAALDQAIAGNTALPAWPDVAPAELEDGQPVAPSTLLQLMCDCEITRIVMSPESVPIDLGRTKRLYDKSLRRAVTTRDRHCQWPHCTLRASWCEVHHIVWFSRGGRTSIDNGITLCSFHHHRVHSHHVRITRTTGGFAFHSRHGEHIGTTTRDSVAASGSSVPWEPGPHVVFGSPDTHTPSPSRPSACGMAALATRRISRNVNEPTEAAPRAAESTDSGWSASLPAHRMPGSRGATRLVWSMLRNRGRPRPRSPVRHRYTRCVSLQVALALASRRDHRRRCRSAADINVAARSPPDSRLEGCARGGAATPATPGLDAPASECRRRRKTVRKREPPPNENSPRARAAAERKQVCE
ncbi:MAG TPA: DUF222 domain-containing protein, partial [Actinomycetaceae bacterium]|nr:DUF222 domain-containing protein [Actinomycetaceae bacterium]